MEPDDYLTSFQTKTRADVVWKTFCTDYEQLAQLNAHPAAADIARSALLKLWMLSRSSFRARRTDLSCIFLVVKFPQNLESLVELSRA